MTDPLPLDPVRIGRAEVDPRARRVTVDGATVRLRGRAFDVLMLLVAERDRVVGKDEILAAVWPRQVVEENNLQVQIAALRRALGHDTIVTVSGRGYRLAVPVLPAAGAAQAGAAAANPPPAPPAPHAPPATPQPRGDAGLQEPPKGNLPRTGPWVGRAGEIAHCEAALASARLLSLTGPGGIGKTRLALQLAHRRAAGEADGAWFVELAAMREAGEVLGALARLFDVGAAAAASATTLAQALASRSALIVLDNCEHLLAPVAVLAATLLAHTRGIKLLVTTQEPLRVQGEQRFALGGLSLPGAMDLEAARTSDAVTLFVQRARLVVPEFSLDAGNTEAVCEICQRLDGVALAIEMAAARLPLLGLQGVRERLGERLRLLATGQPAAPERHRTMRATLQWSLALLDAPERALFRRAAVFIGGFSAAALRAVHAALPAVPAAAAGAPADGDDEWALLDRLGRLVDKSLVVAGGGASPRFSLLETVRAIAVEEAQAAGEWEALRRAHAAWARAHFARAASDHVEMANAHWLARYIGELDNLREALRYASGAGADGPTAAALAGASVPCWFVVGLETEALRHLEATRPFVEAGVDADVAAQWWTGLATLALRRIVPVAQAVQACDRALALYERSADRRQQYKLWCMRAYLQANAGEVDAARQAIARAVAFEDAGWSPIVLVNRQQAESALHTMSGALDLYLEAERRAARLYAAAGKPTSELVALSNVADAQLALGDAAAALSTVREVIERRRALRLAPTAGSAHVLLAALIALGDLGPARAEAAEAVLLARRSGALGDLLDHVALMLALEGRARDAARLAGCADQSVRARGFPRQPAEARSRGRAQELLQQALPGTELSTLLDDGAALSEEAAAALVARPTAP